MGVPMPRILLVDDHRIIRTALAAALQSMPDCDIVGEAADGEEAVEAALRLCPDVIVMDISMPKLDGIEATRRIVPRLPGVRVIGLSMHESREIRERMLSAGAVAYIPKGGDLSLLITAIRDAGKR